MAKPKIKPSCDLRVNTYAVVTRAIEEGIGYGWNRAHKHTATPDEQTIKTEIENAVRNALSEILVYPDICEADDES